MKMIKEKLEAEEAERQAILDAKEAEKAAKQAEKEKKDEPKEADKKGKKDNKKADDKKKDEVKALTFDLDNCRDRIVRLTKHSSSLGDAVLSKNIKNLLFSSVV